MVQTLTSAQRTATLQLAGTININVDSNLCSGTGTRFRDPLKAGDVVVIARNDTRCITC